MTASPNHRILYEQNDFPAFQNRMYPTRDDARTCPRADLRIVEDLETGLVYNAAFRPEIMNYDAFYQNDQSTSTIFQAHLNDVAGIVRRTLGLTSLVEVGCGKGMFLDLRTALGADIVGFDPTYEGSDPRIRREYFTQGIGIAGEGIILRHVLEHIPDPVSFLFDIAEANGNRGRIYIEVPCFDWICENHVWYDIFHEHVNYFRLGDFHRIFRSVVESGHVFGGQYIYVVGDLASLRRPKIDQNDRVAFPADFSDGLASIGTLTPAPTIIWGGASKGVILALMCERAGRPVETVIDISPAKQGLFLAATGLQVRSPAEILPTLETGTPIYVVNSNYLDEVRAISQNRLTYITIDRAPARTAA